MVARLPRQVWQLGWISFFADIASEMAYPILPLFLKGALRAPASALGVIEGIPEAVVSFMKGWSGWQSDRLGRRVPFIRWGYGLSAVGKPLIAFATAWPMVLFSRSLDRLGKGLRTTARDALIVDCAGREQLGRAFGLHRGMDTAGALVGVLLTYLLLVFLPGEYRLIFLLAAIPGLFSVWLTFRLRERAARAPEPPEPEPETETPIAAPLERTRFRPSSGYYRALGLSLVFGLANSSDAFLILRASDLGLAASTTVLAYALYNVSYTLVSYPAGALSDRVGRYRVLGAGWLLYAGVYLGFSGSSSLAVWPLFAVYGIYMGMTQGVTKALVADHAPPEHRGTALGMFFMASGLVTLLGNVGMGLVWDCFGAEVALRAAAGVALLALAMIPLTRRFESGPLPAR